LTPTALRCDHRRQSKSGDDGDTIGVHDRASSEPERWKRAAAGSRGITPEPEARSVRAVRAW
jgi:hypothetical protein